MGIIILKTPPKVIPHSPTLRAYMGHFANEYQTVIMSWKCKRLPLKPHTPVVRHKTTHQFHQDYKGIRNIFSQTEQGSKVNSVRGAKQNSNDGASRVM